MALRLFLRFTPIDAQATPIPRLTLAGVVDEHRAPRGDINGNGASEGGPFREARWVRVGVVRTRQLSRQHEVASRC